MDKAEIIYEVKIRYEHGNIGVCVDNYPVISQTEDEYQVRIFGGYIVNLNKREDGIEWTADAEKIPSMIQRLARDYISHCKNAIEQEIVTLNLFIRKCKQAGVDVGEVDI